MSPPELLLPDCFHRVRDPVPDRCYQNMKRSKWTGKGHSSTSIRKATLFRSYLESNSYEGIKKVSRLLGHPCMYAKKKAAQGDLFRRVIQTYGLIGKPVAL